MYIVEMFNGKSNKLEIMGLDSEGELYVEKVVEDGPPTPDYRSFRCSGFNWPKILELGRQNGWVPAGSVFEKTISNPVPARSDYEPPSWGDDLKIFTAEDASNLADALAKALAKRAGSNADKPFFGGPVLLVHGMTETEFNELNDQERLTQFIDFLRKGQFNFVWDD
jgi:hypothetical protein